MNKQINKQTNKQIIWVFMSVTEALKALKRRTLISGERITVSLRLEPVLHARLMVYVQKTQQVANVCISDALELALKKAGR